MLNKELKKINELIPADKLKEISIASIEEQLKLFYKGVKVPVLIRPCKVGDGIIKLDSDQHKELLELYNKAALEGRLMKFVPASGAASRMFQKLQSVLNKYKNYSLSELESKKESDKDCKSTLEFLQNISKFAFYNDLKSTLNLDDEGINKLIVTSPAEVLKAVLFANGLDYSTKPKGAIKFHKYEEESRTAFEEQVYEALHYLPDRHNKIKIHFTISEEHTDLFNKIVQDIKSKLSNTEFKFDITYSYQKKSTNTIAVDLDNHIILEKDGSLFLRPSGHGALLENLNDLNADIILIKNIDNLSIENLADDTFLFKKLLTGYLVKIQSEVFDILNSLESNEIDDTYLKNAVDYLNNILGVETSINFNKWNRDQKKKYLFEKLNRPIRVCGVVKNTGEPGGGPFWVKEDSGEIFKQIIESAQVNFNDENQKNIFKSSTHFNPVDMVCSVKDFKGVNFNLTNYRDNESGIITIKSKDGVDIKVIELPGLWNGGMANWITVFVEVPITTFNPVKEINDLLRKEHQPD